MDLIGYNSDYYYEDPVPKAKKRKQPEYCCYCRERLTRSTYTKDHLHPKSKGGKMTKPCCRECNSEKANMTMLKYKAFLVVKLQGMTIGLIDHNKTMKKISSIESLLILHPNLMNL